MFIMNQIFSYYRLATNNHQCIFKSVPHQTLVLYWFLLIQNLVVGKVIEYFENSNICLIHDKYTIYQKEDHLKVITLVATCYFRSLFRFQLLYTRILKIFFLYFKFPFLLENRSDYVQGCTEF